MTEQQIIPIIQSFIDQALAGNEKENPKLDFKSKWYNLKDDIEANEFLKDTSSIANTPGLDGYIVLGYDEKTKTLNDTKFTDSGLKDTNELSGFINKRVDRLYNISFYNIKINGSMLSVLHIPPSFDKPHVIRSYKNKNGKEEHHRVFIKNGSTTRIATKYDYDFIAYDRKNQVAEYSLHISSLKSNFKAYSGDIWEETLRVNLDLNLVIENNGLRPVAINEICLSLQYEESEVSFVSLMDRSAPYANLLKVSNIVVMPATIHNYTQLTFQSIRSYNTSQGDFFIGNFKNFKTLQATIRLNTGKELIMMVQLI